MREYRSRRRDRAAMFIALSLAMLGAWAPAALGATPNDPSFELQWGAQNTGQLVPEQEPPEEVVGKALPGTPGADDRAVKAWNVTTGSPSIVIGELDTGVEYNHADLAANIWSNPLPGYGSCPPGSHGFNVVEPVSRCDPVDRDTGYGGHGTHVAGIMGAVGGNGKGVAGMNWRTTILPVRFVKSGRDGGAPKQLVEAIEWLVWVKNQGVNIRVVNDSPTAPGAEPAEVRTAIELLGRNNILFVTAAGNSHAEHFPCSDLPNEICVTASNDHDELPSWANFGAGIDLAAPCGGILSTLREPGPEPFGHLTGGSR